MIEALLLALAAASDAPVSYNCQAEKQIVVQSKKGDWNYSAGDVSKDNRKTFRYAFDVIETADGSLSVTHTPGIVDALGLGGTYEATKIAPDQFAFATKKEANCLFTELGCGALVEISDIDEKKASFSLVPMGSVKTEDDKREILQLIMLGTCKKSRS